MVFKTEFCTIILQKRHKNPICDSRGRNGLCFFQNNLFLLPTFNQFYFVSQQITILKVKFMEFHITSCKFRRKLFNILKCLIQKVANFLSLCLLQNKLLFFDSARRGWQVLNPECPIMSFCIQRFQISDGSTNQIPSFCISIFRTH